MTGPRSAKLFTWASTGNANGPAFVSPAGMTTIVKSVKLVNTTGAAILAFVAANSASNGVGVFILHENLAAGALFEWNGWLILNPGDWVYPNTTAAGVNFWASGSILSGAPPVVSAEESTPLFVPPPPDWYVI